MECTTFRESMLEALYGEAGPDTVRRVEQHLGVCAACRDEMGAFRRVRADLRGYTLSPMAAPRHVRRPGRATLVLATAATLLIALGAALAQARIGDLERRLDAQQESHAREVAQLRAALLSGQPGGPRPADAAVLDRVDDMLRRSEERQAQRLDASMRELRERSEIQRRYDLARVSAGLSYLDGRSGQHAARTAELMGYLLQAAERK
jgi:hypothetical protein